MWLLCWLTHTLHRMLIRRRLVPSCIVPLFDIGTLPMGHQLPYYLELRWCVQLLSFSSSTPGLVLTAGCNPWVLVHLLDGALYTCLIAQLCHVPTAC